MNALSNRTARPSLERIADWLADVDLAPIIDRELHAVRAICPVCLSPDPLQIWRSLTIATYAGLRVTCVGGCRDKDVHQALRALLMTRPIEGGGMARAA